MSEEFLSRQRNQDTVPTARELAIVLFRRRRVFLWVSLAVLVSAVAYAALGTKYEATMKILVRRGRAEAPLSAGENAPLDLTRMAVTEEELNSEVELLRDDDVLRRVVQETGVGGRDWFHFLRLGEGPQARVERAARRLAKKLTVEPVKKTDLITIRYATSNPENAEKVLRSVAEAYLEKHMSVHRPAGEAHFFEQQMDAARKQLDESQQTLFRFSAAHGAISAALQRDKAKGIASLPVLINSGNRYRAPETASPALFNHVLSYLPEFDLYVDSTVGVAPFGILTAAEYGKPVALAVAPGAFLTHLPLVAAEENEETLQTTAQLSADGTVAGQSTTTASGPFGIRLRELAAGIEAKGREQMAATELRKLGWPGKGSFEFEPPRDGLAPNYTVSGSFELEARPEFMEGKAFAPPQAPNAGSPGRISARLLDVAENRADTLLLRPPTRGVGADPTSRPGYRIAAERQDR